jgi:hypothetical protein
MEAEDHQEHSLVTGGRGGGTKGDQMLLSTPTAPSPKRLWRVGDLTLPHQRGRVLNWENFKYVWLGFRR